MMFAAAPCPELEELCADAPCEAEMAFGSGAEGPGGPGAAPERDGLLGGDRGSGGVAQPAFAHRARQPFGILGCGHDHEVITADVPDEGIRITTRFAGGDQDLSGELDHRIAAHESVVIVEGLEIVEIGVDDGEFSAVGHSCFEFPGDPEVTREAGEG